MAEDASLDDFLGSGAEDTDEERDAGGTGADSNEDGTVEDAIADAGATASGNGVEGAEAASSGTGDAETATEDDVSVTPATTTYAWSDDGAACEDCGAPAERRWHQDGALVCPDCKVW